MQQEFDEIYRLYAQDVYRFLYGLCRNEALASDLLQDTMLNAVTSIDQFKGECSLKTYLCRIGRNLYFNHLKRAEQRNLPLDETMEAVSDGGEIEEQLADKMQAAAVHRVLHTLEEPYKEIFSLRVFAELKFSEIGNLFGKTENWARVSFFRAKEKIIRQLEQEELL